MSRRAKTRTERIGGHHWTQVQWGMQQQRRYDCFGCGLSTVATQNSRFRAKDILVGRKLHFWTSPDVPLEYRTLLSCHEEVARAVLSA